MNSGSDEKFIAASPPPTPHQRFLDPERLIASSKPMAQTPVLTYVAMGFIFTVVISTLVSRRSAQGVEAVKFLSAIAMFLIMVGMSVLTAVIFKKQRLEQQQLESIEELIRLRRWQDAGMLLQQTLSTPARTLQGRTQGLMFLAVLLARYHRYADAIIVYEYLLDTNHLDPSMEFGLKLGRGMSILHEERLIDADRAINELRKLSGSEESGGLPLLEIYRDVKTGHPAEAIAIFQEKLPLMQLQLGHRVAEAWALVAKAYDMVGQVDSARFAYENATALLPIAELSRKYVEVASLTGKYLPVAAPAEQLVAKSSDTFTAPPPAGPLNSTAPNTDGLVITITAGAS